MVQTTWKKEAFAESFRKICQKLKKRWQMCFRACLPISPFIEILLNFLPALYYKMILAAYYFYVIHFLFYWHLHLSMKILPLWTAAYNLRSYQTGWIQNNMANITNFWCFPYSWPRYFLPREIKEYQRLKSSTFIVA